MLCGTTYTRSSPCCWCTDQTQILLSTNDTLAGHQFIFKAFGRKRRKNSFMVQIWFSSLFCLSKMIMDTETGDCLLQKITLRTKLLLPLLFLLLRFTMNDVIIYKTPIKILWMSNDFNFFLLYLLLCTSDQRKHILFIFMFLLFSFLLCLFFFRTY